ncbi:hypothetical protein BCV72DRAFT_197610 [Rhizopus microsporus var. microsporus]|uniref:BZIP domain-containing protein n=1 Tax=Rhizopus microsporus var. microsporus TaxID=86635 RepID=A0A1X0RHT7_RHIZD|nr:hypothetical protein BCV72DRAFT_197610 [Rhizopus microsporus var. microsporus]
MAAIYVSNIPPILSSLPQQQQQQQQVDENGQPIKIRKKPGRKPNPASPALRKAQNRAAQRAFRERKEKHLRDLEGTIRQLREQRNSALKELHQTKSKMDAYRAENWYLKGVVLTLQFVCLHHHIHIPPHSPYLTEEALSEMAKTQPHAIEAYVNAYTKNNVNLKPTMAAHFANVPKGDSPEQQHAEYQSTVDDDEEENEQDEYDVKVEDDESMHDWMRDDSKDEREDTKKRDPSSLSAIQHIRLQLRVQSTLTHVGKSAARLQPTILQLAIPHDPRIDLVPTPHMRDRMIIFRDIMNYDRCFAMLLNGAVCHGSDPTMSANWELPAEFFHEFWYLTINYDVNRTNAWRRLKGLPDITAGAQPEGSPEEVNHDTPHSTNETVWTDDVFSQMTAGMPTLQPLDMNHFSSGFDFGSPNHPSVVDDQTESYSLYNIASDSRDTRSPSIGTMMELMNTLSTNI